MILKLCSTLLFNTAVTVTRGKLPEIIQVMWMLCCVIVRPNNINVVRSRNKNLSYRVNRKSSTECMISKCLVCHYLSKTNTWPNLNTFHNFQMNLISIYSYEISSVFLLNSHQGRRQHVTKHLYADILFLYLQRIFQFFLSKSVCFAVSRNKS